MIAGFAKKFFRKFFKKFFTPETSPAPVLSAANGCPKGIARAAFLILCGSFFRASDYRRATVAEAQVSRPTHPDAFRRACEGM
jgi:hypothetical protein